MNLSVNFASYGMNKTLVSFAGAKGMTQEKLESLTNTQLQEQIRKLQAALDQRNEDSKKS